MKTVTYTIDQQVESPIMLIDKHIGYNDEDGPGIDGSLFQRELMSLDGLGKKSIQCWVNTPGGNVFEGYMMVNAILASRTPVDTYNIGLVASMGFPIFMAGRKRIMMDYAIAMIHMPFQRGGGGDEKQLKAMGDSMVTMIASRSKLSEKEVRDMLEAETWLNAEECLKYGFATEIERTSQANRKWMPSEQTGIDAVWKQAKVIAANAINKNFKTYNMSMTKVCMKLGLNEAATEDNIVESIKTIESRAYAAETRIIQMEGQHQTALDKVIADAKVNITAANEAKAAVETQLATVTASLTAKEAEYVAIKTKYDAMEAEKNAAIEEAKKTKATTMVAAFVKSGRLKNEQKVIEKWVALATADYDGTKEMIDALPLNKESVKIETIIGETKDTQRVMGSAEFKMQEILQRTKAQA